MSVLNIKQQGMIFVGVMAAMGSTGSAMALNLSLETIKARPQDLAAIGITANGSGVSVGNVDGDIDLTHPTFPGGTSVVDFSGSGLPGAEQHPTLSSSIIGGIGGDGVAPGVAPGVTLEAANVFIGLGGTNLNVEGAAQAIFTQASNGFDVINMSLGGSNFGSTIDGNSTFTKFLDWVVFTEDVVFTKSAGNNGRNGSSTITNPGDAYNIITVGATGEGIVKFYRFNRKI